MAKTNDLPIVVTGAASGIGACTCDALRAAGQTVIGLDRNPSPSFIGDFVTADLSTPAGVAEGAEQLPANVGGLLNIAGVPGTAPASTVLAVNVFGLRDLTRSLAPRIAAGGSIVNLSSSVAENWRENRQVLRAMALSDDAEGVLARAEEITAGEAYLRSKEAVRLLTEHFAAELLPRRIRVVSVSPGPVDTPILDDFRTDHGQAKVDSARDLLGRFGRPEDIAAVVAFLVSPQASWINGTDVRVDGGLMAWRAQNS